MAADDTPIRVSGTGSEAKITPLSPNAISNIARWNGKFTIDDEASAAAHTFLGYAIGDRTRVNIPEMGLTGVIEDIHYSSSSFKDRKRLVGQLLKAISGKGKFVIYNETLWALSAWVDGLKSVWQKIQHAESTNVKASRYKEYVDFVDDIIDEIQSIASHFGNVVDGVDPLDPQHQTKTKKIELGYLFDNIQEVLDMKQEVLTSMPDDLIGNLDLMRIKLQKITEDIDGKINELEGSDSRKRKRVREIINKGTSAIAASLADMSISERRLAFSHAVNTGDAELAELIAPHF